jgi:hypothetical protein
MRSRLALPTTLPTAALALVAACADLTAPPARTPVAVGEAPSLAAADPARAARAKRPREGCSFSRGTTTCVTVSRSTETETIRMTSGCTFGPTGIPGRRTRTLETTYLVTATTTTLSPGVAGRVYDTSTSVSRELAGSVLVSDVCEAL